MSFYKLENFAIDEVAVALGDDPGDTTLTVADGSVFPDAGDFMIVVAVAATASEGETNIEIMKCTARAGNDLTVERAQEGTSRVTHAVGEIVALRVTKGVVEEITDDITTHKDLTTGVHGLGVYVIGSSTSAEVTLYVDAGAGNDVNAGTSASPKATIKGALDALPSIIAHICTICVRGQQNYAENNTALEFARFTTLASITIKAVNSSDENMYDTGKATSGANTTLTQSTKSWSVDQFNGAYIWIYGGTGAGQVRTISDTTATVITVSAAWDTNPDATSYYAIGGGASLTGTDSFQVRVDGQIIDIYGFRSINNVSRAIIAYGGNINVYNNYIESGARGVNPNTIASGWCRYNYITCTSRGIELATLSSVFVRSNVIGNAAIGLNLRYESVGMMSSAAADLNYIFGCTTGVTVSEGSGCPFLSDQVFGAGGDANTTDIDPAVSETVPNWYT